MRRKKVDVKPKRRTRATSRVGAVKQVFNFAKLLFKVAIAADTVRRVLASEGRRDALRRFGQRAQSTVAHR